MITIAELFPLYDTCVKWNEVFKENIQDVHNRIVKEYTQVHRTAQSESWYLVNKCPNVFLALPEKRYLSVHREDGPAFTLWRKDGTVSSAQWILHNEYTRIIIYNVDGTIAFQQDYEPNVLKNNRHDFTSNSNKIVRKRLKTIRSNKNGPFQKRRTN